MIRKIKMVVAYNGTEFLGWQVQLDDRTVAGTLERVYRTVFGEQVSILGASRTDAGVHALGQVAVFKTALLIDLNRMRLAWNASLPKSISIRSLIEADDDFHPFSEVVSKTYYYHVFMGRPLPFVADFGWQYQYARSLRLDVLEKSLKSFIGTHDFGSFCTVDPDEKQDTVRTIYGVNLRKISRFGILQVAVMGKSFVRFQIRRMVGAAFDVARRDGWSSDVITQMLNNPNPIQNLVKAPGSGLCLRKIIYQKDIGK